jgi:hypothetical protein
VENPLALYKVPLSDEEKQALFLHREKTKSFWKGAALVMVVWLLHYTVPKLWHQDSMEVACLDVVGKGKPHITEKLPTVPPIQIPDSDDDSETDDSETDDSKTDDSKTDDSKTDDSKTDDSETDDSRTDDSKTDDSKADDSKTEEPGTEEPGTEEPGTEEPGTEEPGTEEPGTEEPGTEEPGIEGSGIYITPDDSEDTPTTIRDSVVENTVDDGYEGVNSSNGSLQVTIKK